MEVSRRDFLRFSVAAGTGTALSGLVGSGVNLSPTVARAYKYAAYSALGKLNKARQAADKA